MPPATGYLFDNQSGNTLKPGSFSVAAGDKGSYSYIPDNHGGLSYFSGSTPITNSQYGKATGQDYGALEAAAHQKYFGNVLGAQTSAADQAAAAQAAQDAKTKADNIAYLNDQQNQLRSLLTRTDTGLNQGLTRNEDQYNTQLGGANTDHTTQVTNQNLAKQSQYDTINKNASNGYRSLAQIIGRASGTGSSAFQEMLPDVIGKDTSSKRMQTTDTYGRNLSSIEGSYQNTLADLLRQKKANEESLRSGVESQRQNLNQQLAQNAAQIAQNNGGGFAAIKAAQAPYQSAIENSRNNVESFFNQFRTAYTPTASQPNLNEYTTDRSTVNAQNNASDGTDPMNPYAALLRKKLQGIA